jgi:hypothetical protein
MINLDLSNSKAERFDFTAFYCCWSVVFGVRPTPVWIEGGATIALTLEKTVEIFLMSNGYE